MTLEFDCVRLEHTWPYDTPLGGVSFAVRPGELTFVTLEPGHVRSSFADLTQALIDPEGGEVRFLGQSWQSMKPRIRALARTRIGRVFDVGGWISNLGVDENVLLARRHHGVASAGELRDQADALARTFGLDRVPRKPPADASQDELRLSQWVRALLADVDLLVLERPTRDVRPEAVPAFLDALDAARRRGAAVLWVATAGAAPDTPQNIVPPDVTMRLCMRGMSLVPYPGS